MELDVFSLCLGGSCASAPPPLSLQTLSPPQESPPSDGFSPWDDHNHAYRLFKTQSKDQTWWFLSYFLPPESPGSCCALFVKLGLIKLVWFGWLCRWRGLILGYGNLSGMIQEKRARQGGWTLDIQLAAVFPPWGKKAVVLDVSEGSDKNGKKGILSVECLEKMWVSGNQ